jgi:hypothetical protein
VPAAAGSTYLTVEPVNRVIEAHLSEYEDEWASMMREARVRERREEDLIRVPGAEPPDTDWEQLLVQAKARSETPRPTPAPLASSPPAPAPLASSNKFAVGTVPPASMAAPKPTPSTAFLPAPRPASKRDDEWETVIARAKARASTSMSTPAPDPWDDVIKQAKGRGAA